MQVRHGQVRHGLGQLLMGLAYLHGTHDNLVQGILQFMASPDTHIEEMCTSGVLACYQCLQAAPTSARLHPQATKGCLSFMESWIVSTVKVIWAVLGSHRAANESQALQAWDQC